MLISKMSSEAPLAKIPAVRKLTFSIAEASAYLGVSDGLLRLEAQRRRLKILRIGGRVLIPRSEICRLAGLDADAAIEN